MRTLLKAIVGLILIVFVIALQFVLSQLLPFPLDKINVIFGCVVLMLLLRRSGLVVWLSFFLHYLIELYSTTPFGVVLFSGTISTLLLYWLSKEVFSSPRPLVALGIGSFGIILYRIIYTITLYISTLFIPQTVVPFTGSLAILYMWELVFTTGFILLMYLILQSRVKK